jgi:hypothetical protein
VFWVFAAYYRWSAGSHLLVSAEEGMTLAATSWVPAAIVGAAVYAAARPPVENKTADPVSALRPAAKALAAALIALPFVLQGVPAVVAPRLVEVNVVTTCNGDPMLGTMVDMRMAVQWVPSAPYDDVDRGDSFTIAMVNGQAITPLELPALIPHDRYFHRRYLMAGSTAQETGEAGQAFTHGLRYALFRAATLGASPQPGMDVRAEMEICSL